VPDAVWGEIIAAVVLLREGAALDLDQLRDWCADRLSGYKQPRRLVVQDVLPRNAMGKVLKPELARQLAG